MLNMIPIEFQLRLSICFLLLLRLCGWLSIVLELISFKTMNAMARNALYTVKTNDFEASNMSMRG